MSSGVEESLTVILASHGKINSKRCLDSARHDIQTKLRGEKATKGRGIERYLVDEPQSKARIKFSTVMREAARQTRNCTPYTAHTRKIALTIWAFVEIAPQTFADWKRKIMAPLFVGDS
jgi:hypothetical protein